MIIKEKRTAASLTQEVLARMLGVSQATVAMWETGKSLPRAEMLIKLASVLDCTVDELLTGTPVNKGA